MIYMSWAFRKGNCQRPIKKTDRGYPLLYWRGSTSRLLSPAVRMYNTHMKRTNLVLDGELLDEATRLLGVKTYSATVNLALAEVLRLRKIQGLPHFFGRGLWKGNLPEMREDKVAGRSRRGHR